MAITLTTFRAEVRNKLRESTASYWTNADVDRAINEARVRAEERLMAYSGVFYSASASFTWVAGTQEYALPTLFLFAKRVECPYLDPTHPTPLQEIGHADARESIGEIVYYFDGNFIGFVMEDGRAPQVAFTAAVTMDYVALQTEFTPGEAAPDTPTVVGAIEALKWPIVNWAAYFALITDNQEWGKQYERQAEIGFRDAIAVIRRRQRQYPHLVRSLQDDWYDT